MKPKQMVLVGEIIVAVAGVCLLYVAYQNRVMRSRSPRDLGLDELIGEIVYGKRDWIVVLSALLIVGTMIALAGKILDRLDQSPRPPGSPGHG